MSSLKAGPNCMAVDKKGRIFVGTGGTYQLHMFDTDGTLKTVFGTGVVPTAATYSDGEQTTCQKQPWGQHSALHSARMRYFISPIIQCIPYVR